MKKRRTKPPGTGRKLLRALHLYLACVWGGGASSLFAIHCLYTPETGTELYARNLALLYVDSYILVPSALGCLLTGLLYCHLTSWGYLKYYWLIAKLGANLIFLLAGFFWFIPWIGRMVETSFRMGRFMEIDPGYHAAMQIHMVMAASQAILVFVLVLISVFKPWGKSGLDW
jgi:hypothetical protein